MKRYITNSADCVNINKLKENILIDLALLQKRLFDSITIENLNAQLEEKEAAKRETITTKHAPITLGEVRIMAVYRIYINLYGPPEEGIFDPIKIAQIKKDYCI